MVFISMAGYSYIGVFLFSPIFMLIIAFTSIILSIIALILARRAVKKTTFKPIHPREILKKKAEKPAEKPIKEALARPTELAVPAEGFAKRGEFEIEPAAEGEEPEFSSLEEFAQMVGMNSILLFNIMGMPIEAYNIEEEDRISASTADFVSTIRRLGSDFDYLTIEDERRMMLLSIGKVGEMEVFALAIGNPESALGAEEVRDLLRMYVSSVMRRTK